MEKFPSLKAEFQILMTKKSFRKCLLKVTVRSTRIEPAEGKDATIKEEKLKGLYIIIPDPSKFHTGSRQNLARLVSNDCLYF